MVPTDAADGVVIEHVTDGTEALELHGGRVGVDAGVLARTAEVEHDLDRTATCRRTCSAGRHTLTAL